MQSTDGVVELGNITQDMSSMPVIRGIDCLRVSDPFGTSDEVFGESQQSFGNYAHLGSIDLNNIPTAAKNSTERLDVNKDNLESSANRGKLSNSLKNILCSEYWPKLADFEINAFGTDDSRENCNEDESPRLSLGQSKAAPAFSIFGKTVQVDENGYAIMRPIIHEDSNRLPSDSLNTTYISMYGDGSFQDNVELVLSTDSSGCSSDAGNRTPELPPRKTRFSDTDFSDEAISLQYFSPSSSLSKLSNTYLDSTERKQVASLPTTGSLHRFCNGSNHVKSRLVTVAFGEHLTRPSSPVNIRRPNIIKLKLLDDDETIPPAFNTIEEINPIHEIPSGKTAQFVNKTKLIAAKLLFSIKVKTKQIRRKYTDIRETTETLISLPRAMCNFA